MAVVLGGQAATAESYTAHVHEAPGGGDMKMFAVGAGDNGMMTGNTFGSGVPDQAWYVTATGNRSMHPAGWYESHIEDSWGATYHGGYGKQTQGGPSRGLLWVGGNPVPTNLHPTGYDESRVDGIWDQTQVGNVKGTIACPQCGFTETQHAGLWRRTPGSFMRLHSTTHERTYALATGGSQHVGFGYHRGDGSQNALYWPSDTSMAINLRPSQSWASIAQAISGNLQGGSASAPGEWEHATIWSGTPGSAIDLNPDATFISSRIRAMRNGTQVGSAIPLSDHNRQQAIAWHGNAPTWINLHARLPFPYNLGQSIATDIDAQGNIVGYVMNLSGTNPSYYKPVVWIRS
jgi:hypothetical protein